VVVSPTACSSPARDPQRTVSARRPSPGDFHLGMDLPPCRSSAKIDDGEGFSPSIQPHPVWRRHTASCGRGCQGQWVSLNICHVSIQSCSKATPCKGSIGWAWPGCSRLGSLALHFFKCGYEKRRKHVHAFNPQGAIQHARCCVRDTTRMIRSSAGRRLRSIILNHGFPVRAFSSATLGILRHS
jgi:hypothetical protein